MLKVLVVVLLIASLGYIYKQHSEINELKSEFNDNSDDMYMIIDGTRQSILDDFDKKIRELKTRIPCINRAVDMTDLTACMK